VSYRFPATIGSLAQEGIHLLTRLAVVLAFVVGLTVLGCWWPILGLFLFLFGVVALPVTFLLLGLRGGVRLAKAAAGGAVGRRIATMLISPTLTVAALASTLPAVWTGIFLGNETLLIAYLQRYRGIIEKVQREPYPTADSGAWQQYRGTTYVADYATPRRVAFEPSEFLDNWSGIVWDPTHEVMKADGFDTKTGRFHAPERITKLFGGDLVACRRLGGDWFDCSFT
jgi:hypothetical protein